VSPLLVHATAVAIEGGAVLLRGPPGAGKSDLALRLIGSGALLVADDQTELRRDGDAVVARPPATIAGLIEVRGLGVVAVPAIAEARVVLLVDLVAAEAVERFPEPRREALLGVSLPVVALAPFEASAAVKLRLARRSFAAVPPHAIFGPC
jgi:HPr kinase/phosphorylase